MAASVVANRLLRAWRFTDRYLTLTGKSCCAGRSWLALDRSLARRSLECAAPEQKEASRPDALS